MLMMMLALVGCGSAPEETLAAAPDWERWDSVPVSCSPGDDLILEGPVDGVDPSVYLCEPPEEAAGLEWASSVCWLLGDWALVSLDGLEGDYPGAALTCPHDLQPWEWLESHWWIRE